MRRAALRRDDGVAIVAAVAVLAILIGLGAVGVREAVIAVRTSRHEADVKAALQAADSAIESATYTLNRGDVLGQVDIDPLHPNTITGQTCIVSTGTIGGDIDLSTLPISTPAGSDGRRWCPEATAYSAGGTATASYRLSELARVNVGSCDGSGTLQLDRAIVAVGRSGTVTRRVYAKLRSTVSLLSGAAVQSASSTGSLSMSGTAKIVGNATANGDIVGSGANVITGNAIPGPGSPPHTATGVVATGTAPACQRFSLPEVSQGTAPSVNDDGTAWSGGCYDSVTLLTIACRPLLTTTGGINWDPVKRTLDLWGNYRLVLTGSTYSFCNLRLEGQSLLEVAPSTSVTRIFLDDPANCDPSISGRGQVTADGTSRIVNCHAQIAPETLQLYAVGNAGIATTQTLAEGASLSSTLRATLCGVNLPVVGDPLVLYAPHSSVQLSGGTAIAGQVAGDTVSLAGSAAVNGVSALVNLSRMGGNPTLPLYRPQNYVECTSKDFSQLPAASPAQDC